MLSQAANATGHLEGLQKKEGGDQESGIATADFVICSFACTIFPESIQVSRNSRD